MPAFIATSKKRPNAAQAQQIRARLRKIDPELALVVNHEQGVMPCCIEAPEEYGTSHMAEQRAAAVAVFREFMPPAL